MIRFFSAAILALCIISQVSAVERGKIGIGVEVFSFLDLINSSYYTTSGSVPPLASISLRVSLSDRFDLDLSYGLTISSEVKMDSASQTSAQPFSMGHVFSIGGVINTWSGENAILGVYGRFIGSISTNSISTGSFPNYYYLSYTAFTPKIGIGIEPSYFFSKNFSMYFRTGLGIAFNPATQYASLKINGNPNSSSGYELKSRKDVHTIFGTDGMALGLRILL